MNVSLTDGVSFALVETADNGGMYLTYGFIDEESYAQERFSHLYLGDPPPETVEDVLAQLLPVVEELTELRARAPAKTDARSSDAYAIHLAVHSVIHTAKYLCPVSETI